MFSGAIRVRDRLRLAREEEAKLAQVQVGDVIGARPAAYADRPQFSPPSPETVIDSRPGDRGALHAALTQLAERDPFINLRQDDVRREISVSLYGEVQKEVIEAALADDYGVAVTFRETTTICVERPVGAGEAVEFIGKEPNRFLATVGLRIDPAPTNCGVEFRLEVELGSMPPAFVTAVEQTVLETLRQGLNGWKVCYCTVTMTHSGYWARQSHAHGTFDASMSSTAGDFRRLTPLVLMSALQRAGTRVEEPIHRFELEIPSDTLGSALAAMTHVRGVPLSTDMRESSYLVSGDIPAAQVHNLQLMLPALARGEGALVTNFDRYQQVRGSTPNRSRTDHNPLNRREYLLNIAR